MPELSQDWQRLHPLTPLLRGGRLMLPLLVVLTDQALRAPSTTAVEVLLATVTPLAFAYGYLSWRVTRFRLDGGDLRLESGLLFRRSRRVPLARLQAVDIVRPLVARALGLAELRLEVVGHRSTEAPLAFLREDAAEQLRARLLALAAGVAEDTPAPAEHVLVTVPARALVVSSVLSGWFAAAALALVGTLTAVLVEPGAAPGLLATVGPAVIGLVAAAGRRVATEWDFVLAESPDGLRIRHGLIETRAQTIPPGRVQALRVVRPWLWRPFGWVRVEVDVAGYRARGSEQQRETAALLPVAPWQVAAAVVARVVPGAALHGPDAAPLLRPPRRARWRSPLAWHNLGARWDERYVVTRTGVLTTVTDVVPRAKVQSLRVVQGPLQRRLRLASLHLDTAGRDVRAVAAHRDAAEAVAQLT